MQRAKVKVKNSTRVLKYQSSKASILIYQPSNFETLKP
jgi:hypothetical protein